MVLVQKEIILNEVISTWLYMEEILTVFTGISKKRINSLLMFDIIQADSAISDDLKHEIEKDGVIIYEKTR